jgi:anti-anti-sigma factor
MTYAIVQPCSSLDIYAIDQLRLEISHNLDAGIKNIIVDCGHIELMNSSLLGVLAAILRQVHQRGAEMFLCSLNPQAQKTIELANLKNVFKMRSDCQGIKQQVSTVA